MNIKSSCGLIQTTKLHPSEYNGLKILEWNVHNDQPKNQKFIRMVRLIIFKVLQIQTR